MEINNTKTFIPHESKQKVVNARFGSVFVVISIVVFIGSVAIGVISFLLRQASNLQLTSYQASLERSRQSFSAGLPIRTIEEFDKRLRAAKDIISKHKSFTGLFNLLERITLKKVQITSFSYTETDNTKKNVVRIVARAPDYKTIAEMNEQFSIDEEARRYITDVVFSNLAVDKKDDNLISFEITFKIDPEFLLYSRYLDINPSFGVEDVLIDSARINTPVIKNQ